MSELPWFRFFPSDWLGGTRGMSAAETGIYITLIATMYERGEPVPEDHKRLARTCGATKAAFADALENLIDEGKIVRLEEGLWNERVSKESEIRAEKSEAAKKSANARWTKKPNKNNRSDDANAMRQASERNANQKPEARTVVRTTENAGAFDRFWSAYPHKVGKRDAQTSFDKALNRVELTELMDGLARYVSKTDDRPWCNPSTWLNQDRWADQPAEAQPRASPAKPQSASDYGYQLLQDAQNDRNRTEDQNHLRLVGPVRQSG